MRDLEKNRISCRKYYEMHREEIKKRALRNYRVRQSVSPEKHRQSAKKWASRNNQHVVAYRKQYCKKNPDKLRHDCRDDYLRRVYGINMEIFKEMIKKQDNKCKICGCEFLVSRNTHVDHDHKTGKVRGILCAKCNLGLGAFNDNIEIMLLAVNYLKGGK